MPRVKGRDTKRAQHDPLEVDILSDIQAKPKQKKRKNIQDEQDNIDKKQTIDPRLSKLILKEARQQDEESLMQDTMAAPMRKSGNIEIDDLDTFEEESADYSEDMKELDENDAKLLNMFLAPKQEKKAVNLVDIILEKIREKEAASGQQTHSQSERDVEQKLPKKVVEAYKQYVVTVSTKRSHTCEQELVKFYQSTLMEKLQRLSR